eukprot:7810020-Alexandrium_andersonii.AAC.1
MFGPYEDATSLGAFAVVATPCSKFNAPVYHVGNWALGVMPGPRHASKESAGEGSALNSLRRGRCWENQQKVEGIWKGWMGGVSW